METVITIAIVVVVAVLVGISFYRSLSGDKPSCPGCEGCDNTQCKEKRSK